MLAQDIGVWIGVISHLRPANVPTMEAVVGPATWYVGEGEGDAYRDAGASSVVESGPQMRSRNAILEDAFSYGATAVELSDDLKRLLHVSGTSDGGKVVEPYTFTEAVNFVRAGMETVGAKLGGIAPTANAFYFNPRKPLGMAHFCVGDFLVVDPSEPRFDEALVLKPDYDFTLQHLYAYGRVARANAILAEFAHYSNKGGVVSIRTPELMEETNRYLKRKWPGCLYDNKKRPTEILMRWPPRSASASSSVPASSAPSR